MSFNHLFGAKLRRVRKGSVVSRYVLCSRGGAGARGGLVFVCLKETDFHWIFFGLFEQNGEREREKKER